MDQEYLHVRRFCVYTIQTVHTDFFVYGIWSFCSTFVCFIFSPYCSPTRFNMLWKAAYGIKASLNLYWASWNDNYFYFSDGISFFSTVTEAVWKRFKQVMKKWYSPVRVALKDLISLDKFRDCRVMSMFII